MASPCLPVTAVSIPVSVHTVEGMLFFQRPAVSSGAQGLKRSWRGIMAYRWLLSCDARFHPGQQQETESAVVRQLRLDRWLLCFSGHRFKLNGS